MAESRLSTHSLARTSLLLALLLLLFSSGLADSYVLLGLGGDDKPERNKEWTQLLQDLYNAEKQVDPGLKGSDQKYDTEDALKKRLRELRDVLHCGDELTIFLVGHGLPDWFGFKKDGSHLTPKDLLALLDSLDCCVGVHLVVSACYSGSFIDDVAKSSHVLSVFTATSDDNIGFTTWIEEFKKDLQKVASGTAQIEALQAGHKSGREEFARWWERVKESEYYKKYKEPKPQEYKSQEGKSYRVYGHIEKVTPTSDGAELEVLLSTGKTVKVVVKKGATVVQFGPDAVDISALYVCEWVVAYGDKVGDEIRALGVRITGMTVKVHVRLEPRPRGGKLGWELEMLTEDGRKVRVRLTDEQYRKLRTCQWLVISGPCVAGGVVVARDVKEVPQPERHIRIHIGAVSPDTLTWWVENEKGEKWKIVLVEGQGSGFGVCNWVEIAGHLVEPGDGRASQGSGVVKADKVDKVAPPVVELEGHINDVGQANGNVLLHVKLKGSDKFVWVVVPPGTRVKLNGEDVDPAKLHFCLDVKVKGALVKPGGPVNATEVQATSGGAAKDAGAYRILDPGADPVHVHSPVIPRLVARNYGRDSAAIAAICQIDSAGSTVFHDSAMLGTPLAPGETAVVSFRSWTPNVPGAHHTVLFRTALPGDSNPGNDTVSMMVSVIGDSVNHPPVLTMPRVAPDSGDVTTHFAYTVTYTDPDGDSATTHDVLVRPPYGDPMRFLTVPVSGNPKTGQAFQYQTGLAMPGVYRYWFEFDDGHGHAVRTPETSGPTVIGR
jgi:hypothetical protein